MIHRRIIRIVNYQMLCLCSFLISLRREMRKWKVFLSLHSINFEIAEKNIFDFNFGASAILFSVYLLNILFYLRLILWALSRSKTILFCPHAAQTNEWTKNKMQTNKIRKKTNEEKCVKSMDAIPNEL